MKRRILSLFLALALLCAALPAVYAATPAEAWANEITILNAVEKDLVAAIRAGKNTLDLSGYRLNRKEVELNELKYYSPYISSGIDITCWWMADGTYVKLDIVCPMNKSEVNAYYDKVDAAVAEVDAVLAAVPDAVDKALVLHDYFIYSSEYDYSNLLANTVPEDSYRTAGILMSHRGVCQGYTYAYMYFMNRAGVECHTVLSQPMDHTWNVVRLGNDYYHVDLTWDDPTLDALGMVRHKFLLLSDAAVSGKRAIGDNHHHDWQPLPVSCSSTEYDQAYWYGVDSPVLFSGSDRYYIKDSTIIRHDLSQGSKTALLTLGEWPVWGSASAYWVGAFSGLFLYEGKLYYNTATELRCLDIATGEDKAVYVPDTSEGYLYGSAVIDGMMYYEIKQSPNESGVRHCIPFAKLTGQHVHSYTALVTPPTCTKQGYTTHTCACGDSYVDSYVNALGHAWDEGTITVSPTETAKGEKTFTCTRCGAKRTEEVPPLPHTHVYTETVTPPTCTEQGYTTYTCACGDSYTDSYVPALGHAYVNGVCTRCGAKQPVAPPATDFNDVKEQDWFYDAVNYAVLNNLMNGVGNGNFAPNDPMTRAMLVTVLWRYAGSPEEGNNNFVDVPDGKWYTQAVAWAAANGIVGGVGNGKFDPNGNITREQMAAILFRYANKAGIDTSKRGNLSGFPDAGKVSGFAKEAIAWAVAESIIGGADGKLLPQGNATRAQVATILMRFIEKFK